MPSNRTPPAQPPGQAAARGEVKGRKRRCLQELQSHRIMLSGCCNGKERPLNSFDNSNAEFIRPTRSHQAEHVCDNHAPHTYPVQQPPHIKCRTSEAKSRAELHDARIGCTGDYAEVGRGESISRSVQIRMVERVI